MTLLPFQVDDVVTWCGELARVVSVRGERIGLETGDGQSYVTTEVVLRRMQPRAPVARDGLA